jgi:hypothetical protein
MAFGVSTTPGKDRAGNLIKDAKGKILSDLAQIAKFFSSNIRW